MIWPDEASQGHTDLYCAKGRSCSYEALFPIPPPQPLRNLLTSEHALGARLPPATISFRKHIQKYNSSLQMASSGINIQSPEDGVSMIAIRGVMHHLLGPLAPPQGGPHQFAQLYIINNADAQATARAVDPGRGGGRGRGRGRARGRSRGTTAGHIVRKVIAREYAVYFMHDCNPPTNSTFTYGKRLYQE